MSEQPPASPSPPSAPSPEPLQANAAPQAAVAAASLAALVQPIAPGGGTGVATAQPPATTNPVRRPPPRPPGVGGMGGRRYGFLCSYCSSRLEAVESMAGQSGTCPTCGNSIVIPILDYRGRLIDPTSGQIIKQDPHPVHAYAAAGHKAPQIIVMEGTDDRFIKCPRCSRNNNLTSNNCLACGLPFTMEGTVGDAVSGTNTWAVASLVLGIVSLLCGFFFVVPPILAIVFGGIALRSTNQATGQTAGSGLAIAGLIMGTLGLVASILFWSGALGPMFR